jgi:RNA polymerase sigma-70 factor (ECF subfamily)
MGMARVGLPVDRISDDALLAGTGSGDSGAALAFVRRFQSHVYGVALAITGDPGAAEDVAQQSFLRAWMRASTFDPGRGNVRAWLTAITRHTAIDALRLRRPEPVDPADLIRLLGPVDQQPEVMTIRIERQSELRQAIRQLPLEQGRALVMAGVYRMTAQEVAETEGIPLGTAKSRIRSAMIKLRETLSAAEVKYE